MLRFGLQSWVWLRGGDWLAGRRKEAGRSVGESGGLDQVVAVGTESGSWVRTSGELNVKTGEAGIQEDYSSLFLFKHAEMLKLGPFNSSKVQVALI